ncbi:FA complementation group M [Xylocopa sonorina]|uniref:FA complementation group M n=1 Tax=Xylocopa sonorina TaxID=1818115 RepID=UPI00403B3191
MELSQNLQISCDTKTKGFDLSAGKTWIYPENYPVRDYQFNIVQACLYNNTMVCLPTGLGKTFIAAVVMYNFWRWYPQGKIIFLAPTKPLVAQQIFACHNIMGLPSTETIELTGAVSHKQREVAWSKKRIIFATPQVFHNDLDKNIVPSDLVKCVVIDEAHKALGKHSYCECIRLLCERNQTFRILALSATPGNKIDNVHEVIQNLLIAHVELRDETSLDIVPYINRRQVDVILVPLSNELAEYKERYIFIMDRHVKILLRHNVLRGNTANISKGRVFHILKEYQKKTNKSGNYGQIVKTLNILITMYHAYELMIRDGLRAFHKFYQNHCDKFWMNEEPQLQMLLNDIGMYLGPFPDTKVLSEGATMNIPNNLVFGHTKFEKLKELLLHHFKSSEGKENNTQVIIFVEYRDIVSEIYVLLLQCQPVIRPQMFVGQAGQKQKQQIKALENFRMNHVNVLISTSIGEEGLDIGEVDLIVCFDISHQSPTRLVQRMGRTGRKRDGHIIILVTDGREHETLKSTMARRDSLNHKILNTSNITSSLYQNNPRMIPDIFTPECMKMHFVAQPKCQDKRYKNEKVRSVSKGNKRENLIKECSIESQVDGTKFSITKYLKEDEQQPRNRAKNNFGILCTNIQSNKVRDMIKLSDVKILSYDGDAINFLTTCALRNSEKGDNMKRNKFTVEKPPAFQLSPSIKDFFNFSVPDIKTVNCLITLSDSPLDHIKNELANDKKYIAGSDSYIDGSMFENRITNVVDKFVDVESKFEDLLDDSSNSGSSKCQVPSIVSERRIDNDSAEVVETANKMNTLKNLEINNFEDILNETASDDAENFRQTQTKDIINDTRNVVEIKNFPNTIMLDDDIKSKMIEVNSDERINKSSRITEFYSNPTIANTNNDSEDDMFEDDHVPVHVGNRLNLNQEIDKSTKVENKLKSSDNGGSIIDTQSVVEEYKWDDGDFEIPADPIQDCMKTVDAPVEKEEICSADNQKWISVGKSVDISMDGSRTSIAKKIASMQKCRGTRNTFMRNDRFQDERKERSSHFFNESNDDEEFEKNEEPNDTRLKREYKNCRKGMKYFQQGNRGRDLKKRKNTFIHDEADVSLSNNTADESTETDTDLEDFVSYTQNIHDTSDMYAHYLKSIRSPIKRQDGFIFKQERTPDTSIEIYSQPVTLDESYINDSFCVANGESEHDELSELEKAEQQLERRKRKRTYNKESSRSMKRIKRRNIINHFSSSSEDETEKLRKEIEREREKSPN